MNSLFSYFFLLIFLSPSLLLAEQPKELREKKCHKPEQGPPGGSESPAFGSFYTTNSQLIPANNLIEFPQANSFLNITHPNDTNFIIQEDGYYFIEYGIANRGETDTTLALAVNNNIEVAGSRLKVPAQNALITIGLIVPLSSGDLLNVVNIENTLDLGINGVLSPNPICAYIDFIYLSPFLSL